MTDIALIALGGVGVGLAGSAAFMTRRYYISSASQYVVRTGLFVKDVDIRKNSFRWPFQKCQMLNLDPFTIKVGISAMSNERIPFSMPSVWTLGPKDDLTNLEKYAKLMMSNSSKQIEDSIVGVIQGEARISTANLTLDEIFRDREKFKGEVANKIATLLEPFGLQVYNSNIAELEDLDDHNKYFSTQKQRALQQVNERARIDVSEANKDGQVGEYENKSEARKRVAELEKTVRLVENDRAMLVCQSDAKLKVAQAQYEAEAAVAKIEAEALAQKRKSTLQQEIEQLKQAEHLSQLRARDLAQTRVTAEQLVEEIKGEAEAERAKAEIAVLSAMKESDAIKIRSDATLYAKQKEAEGLLAVKRAEAEGIASLVSSTGDVDSLIRYLAIRDGVLPKLAEHQSNALKGMQPKINVWNTGSGDGNSSVSNLLKDVMQTGMPLFESIREQTGYNFLQGFSDKSKQTDEGKNTPCNSSPNVTSYYKNGNPIPTYSYKDGIFHKNEGDVNSPI